MGLLPKGDYATKRFPTWTTYKNESLHRYLKTLAAGKQELFVIACMRIQHCMIIQQNLFVIACMKTYSSNI